MTKNFDVHTNLSHHNPAKAQSTKEVYAAFFTLNQQFQQTNERKKEQKSLFTSWKTKLQVFSKLRFKK